MVTTAQKVDAILKFLDEKFGWLIPIIIKPERAILIIDSVPGRAKIDIQGTYIHHVTPERVKLDPGTYSVRIYKKGYEDYSTSITLELGDEKTISKVLVRTTAPPPPPATKGKLVVTANIDRAKIDINGEYTHHWAPETYVLGPGSYVVKVYRTGYTPKEKNIIVKVGVTTTWNAVLTTVEAPPPEEIPPEVPPEEVPEIPPEERPPPVDFTEEVQQPPAELHPSLLSSLIKINKGILTWNKDLVIEGFREILSSEHSPMAVVIVLAKIAAWVVAVMGTISFISFIYEEALQQQGFACHGLVKGKLWDSADRCIDDFETMNENFRSFIVTFGRLAPVAYNAFDSYHAATAENVYGLREAVRIGRLKEAGG